MMNRMMTKLAMSVVVLATSFTAVKVQAGDCQIGSVRIIVRQPRQYHAAWQWSGKGYFYSNYYFKPSPADRDFQVHLCIYTPKHPNCFFYYNPKTGKIWGVHFGDQPPGQNFFKHQGDDLPTFAELAAAKPIAHSTPTIPGSTDGGAMMPPPGTPR